MIIAPSLLAADAKRLGDEVRRVHRAGADRVHWDVMDGHFVPNLSFGPKMVRDLRPLTRLPFEVHLMCSRPEILLEPFAKAGGDLIMVHVELGEQVHDFLWKIKSLGKQTGLVINPPTPARSVRPFLKEIDQLLVMTVNPGFGGQSFIAETLPKIQQFHAWRQESHLNFRIEVDGGVDLTTVSECARAGADTFVSGTALFKMRSMKSGIRKMRSLAAEAAASCKSSH